MIARGQLAIVSTPIGHPKDITLRALEGLKEADLIIGEEYKEVSKLLKSLDIAGKSLRTLNEHTEPSEIKELASLCREQKVCLVSDCGTPGFCDPGFQLIEICRSEKIPVTALPGASSLMFAIALASRKLEQFFFVGFLPAETSARETQIKKLSQTQQNFIFMDTPYRLQKMLAELALAWPDRKALLVLNATTPEERVLEGPLRELKETCPYKKAEFILLVYAQKGVLHGAAKKDLTSRKR